jgi:hypothetical protein
MMWENDENFGLLLELRLLFCAFSADGTFARRLSIFKIFS